MSEIQIHYYEANIPSWVIYSAAILVAVVIVGLFIAIKKRSKSKP